MREANAFAGAILFAGPAKQFENALMIRGRHAPAIVFDLDPNLRFNAGAAHDHDAGAFAG
jgi:hypothetical protein